MWAPGGLKRGSKNEDEDTRIGISADRGCIKTEDWGFKKSEDWKIEDLQNVIIKDQAGKVREVRAWNTIPGPWLYALGLAHFIGPLMRKARILKKEKSGDPKKVRKTRIFKKLRNWL